jgi:hypothetical protein
VLREPSWSAMLSTPPSTCGDWTSSEDMAGGCEVESGGV